MLGWALCRSTGGGEISVGSLQDKIMGLDSVYLSSWGKNRRRIEMNEPCPLLPALWKTCREKRQGRKNGGRCEKMIEEGLSRKGVNFTLTAWKETLLNKWGHPFHFFPVFLNFEVAKAHGLGIRNYLRCRNTTSLKRTFLEAGRLWGSGTACLTSCFKKAFLWLK